MAMLNIKQVKACELQTCRGRRLLLTDDTGNTVACAWQKFRLDESQQPPEVTIDIIEWQRWFQTPDYHFAADEPVDVLMDG